MTDRQTRTHTSQMSTVVEMLVFLLPSFCLCACSTHQLGGCMLPCKEEKMIRITFNSKLDCLSTRWLTSKDYNTKRWWEYVAPGTLGHGRWARKLSQPLWKPGWAVLTKNILCPTTQGLGIYPVPFLGVCHTNEWLCLCTPKYAYTRFP